MKTEIRDCSRLTLEAWDMVAKIIISTKDDNSDRAASVLERAVARAKRRESRDPVAYVDICTCPDCAGF